MADTLEAKIMSLQFKLREVREKRETSRGSCEHYTSSDGVAKTTDVSGDSPSTSSSIARFSSQRGRATPRGRLGGRVALGGRGRGRFGRGGGNMSVDCRPKSLVVSDIPDGFDEVADQHFSRFGKVVNVEKQQNSAGLKIEFASRYEAERALKDGAGYGGAMLTLEWDSLQDLNSVSVQGYAETTNEADRN